MGGRGGSAVGAVVVAPGTSSFTRYDYKNILYLPDSDILVPVQQCKHGALKLSLLSGQSYILIPVQQYKHVVGSPPRCALSGGHDSCQAARAAATCT